MRENNFTERFRHVNPVLLEDAGASLITSVQRLLDYERFLDGLEHLKMRDGFLPLAVERQVGASIQGNLADAEMAGRQIHELATHLEDLGAFEALFASVDDGITPGGVPALLEKHSAVLERWLEQRGMTTSTWRWALQQYADWDGLGARVEAGAIVVTRGYRTIGVISPGRGANVDAASFVARAYGLSPSFPRIDDGEQPIRLSASELLEIGMRELIAFYRRRARRTALDGVQVLPTGVWWVVVIIVIAVLLIAAGASITILCDIGSITSRGVCDLGIVLLALGFLLLLVGVGGARKTRPDPNDPDPGIPHIPDPPG
jgi:hypothetical protein